MTGMTILQYGYFAMHAMRYHKGENSSWWKWCYLKMELVEGFATSIYLSVLAEKSELLMNSSNCSVYLDLSIRRFSRFRHCHQSLLQWHNKIYRKHLELRANMHESRIAYSVNAPLRGQCWRPPTSHLVYCCNVESGNASGGEKGVRLRAA